MPQYSVIINYSGAKTGTKSFHEISATDNESAIFHFKMLVDREAGFNDYNAELYIGKELIYQIGRISPLIMNNNNEG